MLRFSVELKRWDVGVTERPKKPAQRSRQRPEPKSRRGRKGPPKSWSCQRGPSERSLPE